jgi:hypothetical protein
MQKLMTEQERLEFNREVIKTLNPVEKHDGGYDLKACLEYNSYSIPFGEEDIENVVAQIPGHNDEDNWFWIIQLKDGRFALLDAWCDYTGWDCQSGVNNLNYHQTAMAAAEFAPEYDSGRSIRFNLVSQVKGTIPYGLEER